MSAQSTQPALGVVFPRELAPDQVWDFAEAVEAAGGDELWVAEDCFYTTGITLAAAALARTDRITVGLGILPGVARNPAITAMELATLARLAPGRVKAGIGHGVTAWMEQIGARPTSPVTALTETISAVRSLLAGDQVTTHGQFVHLDDVRLDTPPDPVPPVLAGVRGPRSLQTAGRVADGLVLAEFTTPTAVRAAIATAAPPGPFQVTVYTAAWIDTDRRAARQALAPWLAACIASPPPALRDAPFYDELAALARAGDVNSIVDLPDDWWHQLAAVGTPDDVAAHVDALARAGADSIALVPPHEHARTQLDRVLDLFSARARSSRRHPTSGAHGPSTTSGGRRAMDFTGLVKRFRLPDGFVAPQAMEYHDIRAAAITRNDLDDDVRGINASIELIRRTRGGRWPAEPVTLEGNYIDLVWHECEHREGDSFTYVLRDAGGRYLGCCYLYPVGRRVPLSQSLVQHDVDVSWWVTPDAFKAGRYSTLYQALRHWTATAFPFKNPYFSNIEIPQAGDAR